MGCERDARPGFRTVQSAFQETRLFRNLASNGEEAEEMSSEGQSYISPLDRYRLRVEGKLENISAMDQK